MDHPAPTENDIKVLCEMIDDLAEKLANALSENEMLMEINARMLDRIVSFELENYKQ